MLDLIAQDYSIYEASSLRVSVSRLEVTCLFFVLFLTWLILQDFIHDPHSVAVSKQTGKVGNLTGCVLLDFCLLSGGF